MDQSIVIGIDLGGTKAAGALFDREGGILHRAHRYLKGRGGEAAGGLIREVLHQLMAVAEQQGRRVAAVGIGVPGIYHRDAGTVWAPNISGWEAYPLRAEISSALNQSDVEIKIDSDRACYILGEAWRGAAAGCRDVIFLAVGTGIGAGILVDGRVLRGARDIAGAVGWMKLSQDHMPYDPNAGHFEYHASGAGIVRLAQYIYGKQSGITTHAVFEDYQAGVPQALTVVRAAVEFWGRATANLVSIFNPEKVLFGGGVFGPAADLIGDIRTEALKWGQPISMQEVKLEVAQLGSDAGLYGAGYLALSGIK